jgi:hypothetical protein
MIVSQTLEGDQVFGGRLRRKTPRSRIGGVTWKTPAWQKREILEILSRLGKKLGVFTEQKSGIPRLFTNLNPGNFIGE